MGRLRTQTGQQTTAYYWDKRDALQDLFGTTAVTVGPDCLIVAGRTYPIVDDVIVLLEPPEYPRELTERMQAQRHADPAGPDRFAEDIQFSFGEEWRTFPKILPEHEHEFLQYFDLIDLSEIRDWRVCDLGCGMGRWSFFLSRRCREIILVDFSDAIFVARRNLAGAHNALFFLGDLTRLPFRDDFSNLVVCVGVLHHLPKPALEALKALRRCAPRFLVYVYYAAENRPVYFRVLLTLVTRVRLTVCTIRNRAFRAGFTWLVACGLYLPLLAVGRALDLFRWSRYVPLYEAYKGKSFKRICQDAYDRFFTRIEQRHSRQEILTLTEAFSRVTISERVPYWHFVCER